MTSGAGQFFPGDGQFFPSGGNGNGSPWIPVTLGQIGSPVGAAGWTITASGNPDLPLRVTAPASTPGVCVFPLNITGLIPVATWRVYAKAVAPLGGGTALSLVGVGTWDPTTAPGGGTIGSSVGSGVAVLDPAPLPTGRPGYQTVGAGASGLLGTSFGPPLDVDDATVRVDVQTYGFTTGGGNARRVAASHLVLSDGSAINVGVQSATGSYNQTASSTSVGTSDAPCIVCGHANSGFPTVAREIDIALFYLDPSSNPFA